MPAREAAPIGAPCWVDLMTSDTDRSREFYCELFGWAAEEPAEEFGGYFNFTKDGVLVAGCMASQDGAGAPDISEISDMRQEESRLTLVPVTLAKGLEYDHVIIVEPSRIATGEAYGLRRLYVALTRAVSRLTVFHAEPLPAELSLHTMEP